MIDTKFLWFDGEIVSHDSANVHVLSHVIHYGSSVFEGIRAYRVDGRTVVFRLEDHINRLFNSCKIYHMELPFTKSE